MCCVDNNSLRGQKVASLIGYYTFRYNSTKSYTYHMCSILIIFFALYVKFVKFFVKVIKLDLRITGSLILFNFLTDVIVFFTYFIL